MMMDIAQVHQGHDYVDPQRAVLRPAPPRFSVEFLPTKRDKHDYDHGMIISSSDGDSVASRSFQNYEIWRRWVDALTFQASLEKEYGQLAREKRKRLLKGKGVKKNGIYMQDLASSWDSLPPGPPPDSVSLDLHKYLPALSKKGNVFKITQTTLEQRQAQLEAFISALFNPDMPSLIQEIRATRLVTDFFGFWRADESLARKKGKDPMSPSVTPSRRKPKLASDVFYHSPSRNSSNSDTSSNSDQSLRTVSSFTSTTIISGDPILGLSHDPQRSPDYLDHRLATVTEEHMMTDKSPRKHLNRRYQVRFPQGRLQSDAWEASSTHSYLTMSSNTTLAPTIGPTISNGNPETTTLAERDSFVRDSWQSTNSNATIMEGMNLMLPEPIDFRQQSRASMASIATFMTNSSADAIFGSTYTSTPQDRDMFLNRHRDSSTVSLSDFDMWSCVDDSDMSFTTEDFPRPASFCSTITGSPPATPTREYFDIPETREELYRPVTPVLPLEDIATVEKVYQSDPALIVALTPFSAPALCSTSSTPPAKVGPKTDPLSIKVTLEGSTIMLRVPRDTPFIEVRNKIRTKFVGQEGVPLSLSFKLVFVLPVDLQSSSPNANTLAPIESQIDWEKILTPNPTSKITLRIFDTV